MKHVYLSKASIDKAYREGGITQYEVYELLLQLERCASFLNGKSKLVQ